MPPTAAVAVKRKIDALVLRAEGYTQREAAASLGISDRQVRRYEADLRNGWRPKLAPLAGAVYMAYQTERVSKRRGELLALYGRLACEQARVTVAEHELNALRKIIGPLMGRQPVPPNGPEPSARASSPPSAPPLLSRFGSVPSDVAERAAALLRDILREVEPGTDGLDLREQGSPSSTQASG